MSKHTTLAIALTIFAGSSIADDDRSRVEFEEPGVGCLPLDQGSRDRIVSGDLGLILGIARYIPAADSPTIVASLVHSTDGTARELTRVAMYPGGAFEASTDDPARRFQIPLRLASDLIPNLDAACIQVALVDADGQSASGVLEGFIELTSTTN